MSKLSVNLRLLFPQWQGGNNAPYYFGSQLLTWLAPQTQGVVEEVPVIPPDGTTLANENGIVGRHQVISQFKSAEALIRQHNPDTLVVLGGDCLVSLAPFSYLIDKYGDRLGVLWIDSHPDVMTPEQFPHSHAHVLGALMGHGDPQLAKVDPKPLSAKNVMLAGLHDPLEYEAAFITRHGIETCSPEEVKRGAQAVLSWIEREGIEYLAIHVDLDVLNPVAFRSVLFARPGRGAHDFGDVAEGMLDIGDIVTLINHATNRTTAVGITIAEHLPWDAINLKNMLASLPLLSK